MDAAQYYETVIHNRDDGRAFAFAVVPARSLRGGKTLRLEVLAELLEGDGTALNPLEVWSLPFLIDVALGDRRGIGPPPWEPPFEWLHPLRPRDRRWSSPFAEYLAFAPVVPFESSPLGPKSLSELVAGAGGAVGAYVTRDPMLLVTVPAGIILCRAAAHIGDGIGIAVRTLILRLIDADDEAPEE